MFFRSLRPTPSILLVLAILAGAAASPALGQSSDESANSLYHRLGGYDVIAATVDDFFARFGQDPELAPFLGGINENQGHRVRQHFVDFMCAETGGPCLYRGQGMRIAHEGLPITDAHFDLVLRYFREALQAQGVPQGPASELMRMMEELRSEVVAG